HIGALLMDEVPGHVEQLGTSLLTVAGPTGRSAVHGGLRRRIHGTWGIKYRRFYVKCSAEDPAAAPAHEGPGGSASGRSDHVDHEEVHPVTHPDFPRDALVLGGNRIPFARSGGPYAGISNQDMLTAALDGLVARFGLQGEELGEVA